MKISSQSLRLPASILAICILLAFNCAQTIVDKDPFLDLLEVYSDSLLQNLNIESLSLGAIINGKSYKIHKGKLLNGNTPDEETLYEIASITKTFTGTLLAKAVHEKKIQIDEDIRNYLSGDYPNLAYENQPISFRNLLTHQSGLPRMLPDQKDLFQEPIDWDGLPQKINHLQKGYSKTEFFEDLESVKLDTVPGHIFNYSNAGANLLGYILENIYQVSFEELLKKEILDPLAMKNTEIKLSRIDTTKIGRGKNASNVTMPFRVEKGMNAEGGIFSTIDDMIKYMDFQLEEDHPWISLAHQDLWEGRYGDFGGGYYWQLFRDGDNPDRVFQDGGAFGTTSWMTLIPEQKMGIFIITNVSGPNVHGQLNQTITNILQSIP